MTEVASYLLIIIINMIVMMFSNVGKNNKKNTIVNKSHIKVTEILMIKTIMKLVSIIRALVIIVIKKKSTDYDKHHTNKNNYVNDNDNIYDNEKKLTLITMNIIVIKIIIIIIIKIMVITVITRIMLRMIMI